MQSNAHHSEGSQVAHIGVAAGRSCGYCKGSSGSQAFYLRAVTLTPLHYQKLLDIGWRRSGQLLYRPNLKRSCCVQYTIRLDARQFKPSREHRQSLHRWERFVEGEDYIKECARKYPKSREEKKQLQTEFNLFKTVHGPEYSHLRIPPEPSKKFEVAIEPSVFTEEKYALFQHYQLHVHGEGPERVSQGGFRNFLCDSPLQSTEPYPTDGAKRMGSFHQMYRLDGKLIAMSVLDFLPWCVSGVYFIYHKDYERFGFGKLSACREAALAAEEGYTYYYMGFYIHTCPKMRYKAQFHPTYFLDPENNKWNLLDEGMKKAMDEKIYVSPSKPDAVWEFRTNGPDEDDDEYEYSKDEVLTGVTIWDSGMPGVPSIEEIEKKVDLGEVKVKVRQGHFKANQIVQFYDEDSFVRMAIREFAAAVGLELTTEIELRFS